jgi:uncharacterized protein YyaL (SSP411 family)
LPGFADLITHVAANYHERKDAAAQNTQLADALSRATPAPNNKVPINESTIKLGFQRLLDGFDSENGGFGSAPKFPNPVNITLLMHEAHVDNKQAEAMSLQMLTSMASGGIYEQVGGGFCRYSVDEHWNIPHFGNYAW